MNPQNPRQKQNMPKFNLNWVYFLILGALAFLYFSGVGGGSSVDREVDYTTFKSYVSKGYAKRMEVNKGDGTLKMFVDGKHIRDVFGQDSKSTGKAPTVTTKYPSVDKVEEFVDSETKAGHFKGHVSYIQDSNMFWNIIINLLPILLLVALWMFFMRRMGSGGGNGGVFSVGKSKAQLFEKKQGKHITFKDVAGQEGAKREVQEIVDFLKNPKKYTDLGGKIPRGAVRGQEGECGKGSHRGSGRGCGGERTEAGSGNQPQGTFPRGQESGRQRHAGSTDCLHSGREAFRGTRYGQCGERQAGRGAECPS